MVEEGRVSVRRGSEADLEVLVALSQQREKEQRRDTGVEQHRTRIAEMIRSDFVSFLFEACGKIVGYSIVSKKADPLYVAEYFLLPEERGKGHGYDAVGKLMQAMNSTSLDVSSNAWREAAGAM
ncbi:MAG TPA: GNAT family N-acetyltransferase [Methanomassiliicoccales archaeon]|nr:GNAT family N-acetyltransferase [Methanomassiliicoccales archaeon]